MPTVNSGSATVGISVSGDYRIAALQGFFTTGGQQTWQNHKITYSFLNGASQFAGGNSYGHGEISAGWLPLSSLQQAAVREALAAWATVANITFTEVTDGNTVGDLRFGFTSNIVAPTVGHAYAPGNGIPTAGDVWIKSSLSSQVFTSGKDATWVPGTPGKFDFTGATNYLTLLHEIGHALGLSHPFETSGETRGTAVLPTSENNYSNTVMSYTQETVYSGVATSPMPYDIMAIQHMYGANYSYNSGNTTYSYDIDDINYETLWDGGGTDTLVITNNKSIPASLMGGAASWVDLRDGKYIGVGFSNEYWASIRGGNAGFNYPIYRNTGRVMLADGVAIENIVTTNLGDTIFGNALANVIDSGNGRDTIDGGGGIDTSVYALSRSNYTLANVSGTIPGTTTQVSGYTITDEFLTASFYGTTVTGYATDSLIAVERLQFADLNVALDLDGNAGITAKILGAVFGAASISNKTYVGIGLDLLDAGMSHQNVMQLALDARLGAGASSTAIVNLLYTNVVGSAPSPADLAYYKGLLDSGSVTAGALGVSAANHALNAVNIGLVGLAATGIEYI